MRCFLFTFSFLQMNYLTCPQSEIVNSRGRIFNPKTHALSKKSLPSFIPMPYHLQTVLFSKIKCPYNLIDPQKHSIKITLVIPPA